MLHAYDGDKSNSPALRRRRMDGLSHLEITKRPSSRELVKFVNLTQLKLKMFTM